jgi:hypothetical protein
MVVGGMVLLAAGGTAAAIKMSQKDADRIEAHTGASVEELTEEELVQAMRDLGIQSIELDENDQAVIASQGDPPAPTFGDAGGGAQEEPSYLDELERLADLRDRGIISDEEFEAKKAQLLGL